MKKINSHYIITIGVLLFIITMGILLIHDIVTTKGGDIDAGKPTDFNFSISIDCVADRINPDECPSETICVCRCRNSWNYLSA